MKKINYNKWNNYKIGNIPWVNNRRSHVSRKVFIDHILNGDYKNILEIGAGEAIEAQLILKNKPDIDYNIIDVSDTFLDNVRELGLNGTKGEMHKTPFENKQFDIVYLASVIEHSPNLNLTFKELSRISKEFFITMFKWKIKTGGLNITYIANRKYYSSEFNINKLFNFINRYGVINQKIISTKEGKIIKYGKYTKNLSSNIDKHRNGNYISIIGKFK